MLRSNARVESVTGLLSDLEGHTSLDFLAFPNGSPNIGGFSVGLRYERGVHIEGRGGIPMPESSCRRSHVVPVRRRRRPRMDQRHRGHRLLHRRYRPAPPLLRAVRHRARAARGPPPRRHGQPQRSLGDPSRTHFCADLEHAGRRVRFLVRDRDTKFTTSFDSVFASTGTEKILTPVCAPRANAFAERWVRTARQDCLDHLLVLSRPHLERILAEYVEHYNRGRPHRSLDLTPPRRTAQAARTGTSAAATSLADSSTSTTSLPDRYPLSHGLDQQRAASTTRPYGCASQSNCAPNRPPHISWCTSAAHTRIPPRQVRARPSSILGPFRLADVANVRTDIGKYRTLLSVSEWMDQTSAVLIRPGSPRQRPHSLFGKAGVVPRLLAPRNDWIGALGTAQNAGIFTTGPQQDPARSIVVSLLRGSAPLGQRHVTQ